MNRPVWQRRLILTGKIGLAGGLLAWLVLSGRLELGRLASVSLDWRVGVLLALVAGSMIVPAFRWWWLLRIQGLREPAWKVVSLTWAGYFAAMFLPGAVGGDLAKGYLILHRRRQARARALSTVLADRVIGLYSFLVLGGSAIVCLAVRGQAGPPVLAMGGTTIALLLGITFAVTSLLFPPSRKIMLRVLPSRWREVLDESFEYYRAHKAALLGCFLLSLVSSTLTIVSLGFAGRLLGGETPWDATFLAGPLIILANSLPLTPGGLGVAESVSGGLFAGLGATGGAEMMLLLRICAAAASLPGIVALLGLGRRQRLVGRLPPAGAAAAQSPGETGERVICEVGAD